MKNTCWRLPQAMALSLSVLLLASCSPGQTDTGLDVSPGETISANSKWINTNIDGALDANTPVNLKDDFYTAVNRDWLLETTVTKENPEQNEFLLDEDVLTQRKLTILSADTAATAENAAGLDGDLLQHDLSLVQRFAGIAGDWDARNSLGVEPARPYLDAITGIQSLPEMTAYLLNQNGDNFTLYYPVAFSVSASYAQPNIKSVQITPLVPLTLKASYEYNNIDADGLILKNRSNQKVSYLLARLGYPQAEITRILQDSFRFESLLTNAMRPYDEQTSIDYLQESDNPYSADDLKKLAGNYPLYEILTRYGLENSAQFTVWEPAYVKAVSKLYTTAHLEEMKAYYMVHTAAELMPLLDRDAFDRCQAIEEANAPKTSDTAPDTVPDDGAPDTEQEKETKILLDSYIGKYLAEPMDQIYVARYCDREERRQIQAMVDDILDGYREMLSNEDWLSKNTREKVVDKLNNICIRVLYPDTLTDYRALAFSDAPNATLADAVCAIHQFKTTQLKQTVNQAKERSEWDMSTLPTTVANAYYNPLDNSINILAGILATGFIYDKDAPYEQNLARMGSLIGHEITHAFDNNGSQFDKDGRKTLWWDLVDVEKLQMRTATLQRYYLGISPYPGAESYGTPITGEAIADMGSIKCLLGIAGTKPNFDYAAFFTSYAQLWRDKETYDLVVARTQGDPHPLFFLRANVTLQQFDEFLTAFDIQPGDGMYLEPKDRVLVW